MKRNLIHLLVLATSPLITSWFCAQAQVSANAQTTTTISSSNPAGIGVGQVLTLAATVTPPPASGGIAFYDRSTFLGSAVLGAGGIAVYETVQLLPGSHKLKAQLINEYGNLRSTSGYIDQSVWSSPASGFVLGPTFPAGVGPAFAVADVNGDGKVDLIAGVAGGINLYFGNGDGTFQAPVFTPVGAQYKPLAPPLVTQIVATYTPGFGNVGLFVGIQYLNSALNEISSVEVLSSKSDGAFSDSFGVTGTILGPYGTSVQPLQAGDFNHSGLVGLAEILISNFGVNVFIGNTEFLYRDVGQYGIEGVKTQSISLSDFNRDGNLDILSQLDSTVAPISICFGTGSFFQGSPGFGPPVNIVVNGQGFGIAVLGDFNRDGKPDIALPVMDGVEVLIGNGDGTFTPPVTYQTPTSGSTPSVMTADVDGDGKPDLVGTGFVLYGNGDGTFQPASLVANAASGVFADLNGDGKLDIVSAASGQIQVIFGSK